MIYDIQRSQSGVYQGRGHLFRTERREQVPRRNYAVSPRRFSYASVESRINVQIVLGTLCSQLKQES